MTLISTVTPKQKWAALLPRSMNSTGALVAPSVGAFRSPYIGLWGHQSFSLTTTDETSLNSVHFDTQIEMTGDTAAEPPESAIYRLACHLVLAHLETNGLKEAYDSLLSIYEWQSDFAERPATDSTTITKIKAGPKIVRKETAPIEISE